jgi:hypothetical protein
LRDVPLKYPLSKFEYDLFNEEDDVKERVIRVKTSYSARKGDRWKILEDNKIIFIVDGNKLNKKERAFLKTVDGMSWLISQAKAGIRSFNSLKIAVKKKMKTA